jgi:hypothetical protein
MEVDEASGRCRADQVLHEAIGSGAQLGLWLSQEDPISIPWSVGEVEPEDSGADGNAVPIH